MWMHVDTGDYEWARVGVAMASNVSGPYKFLKSFRPHNQHSRDLTVFQVPPSLSKAAFCVSSTAELSAVAGF
jgi:hypothetical protein